MSKTAHNDVTGESIKSGSGGKGNAADSQSKFDKGFDLIWGKKLVKLLTTCAAHRDGECYHKECPQLRDNEPQASGRHCPIDITPDID